MGPRGQNYYFFEYGHVAYQIKGNNTCSNMFANILHRDILSTPGWGQKVKTFFSESSHIAFQIKRNGV